MMKSMMMSIRQIASGFSRKMDGLCVWDPAKPHRLALAQHKTRADSRLMPDDNPRVSTGSLSLSLHTLHFFFGSGSGLGAICNESIIVSVSHKEIEQWLIAACTSLLHPAVEALPVLLLLAALRSERENALCVEPIADEEEGRREGDANTF